MYRSTNTTPRVAADLYESTGQCGAASNDMTPAAVPSARVAERSAHPTDAIHNRAGRSAFATEYWSQLGDRMRIPHVHCSLIAVHSLSRADHADSSVAPDAIASDRRNKCARD